MNHLFSVIAPFGPVRFLTAKNIKLDKPGQDEFTQYIGFILPEYFQLEKEGLPIRSIIENVSMLLPDKIIIPTKLTLSAEENQDFVQKNYLTFLPLLEEEFKNIFVENELILGNTIQLPLEILDPIFPVTISNNLLSKVTFPQSVSGMLYEDRYWKTEKLPRLIPEGRINDNNQKRNSINPIDLHNGGVKVSRPRFNPSFWDLIFVILQPPIELLTTNNTFLPHDLYSFQIEGVKFLISNTHALLADDMGTGKTVMSTVALKILLQKSKIRKALILCPPSILHQWKQHVAEWVPEAIACIIRGPQDIRSIEWNTPAHIYITTYDTLRSDVENSMLPNDKWDFFDLIIIDEAHHIKNSNTSRSKAIKKLRPKYRWALTGTPIQNKIEDMASIFEFVYPNLISQFDLYEERIIKLIAPYFLRRRKQDVMKDLPPKINQDIWLELSEEQKIEYSRIEKNIQQEIIELGNRITKQHIFSKMQRLKQICNFASGKSKSPKIDILKEQVEEITESGNKVIVFTQYIEEGVRKINSSLANYGTAIVIGEQSDSVRLKEIERFTKSTSTNILIASVKSGGEGLNLTEASYVIHFDHWWNPAVMWQAEDRVHRKGQTKNVNIYSYWISDTIDERIYNILKRKGLLIQNIVDGLSVDSMNEIITMDDLLEIMGVRKPSFTNPIPNSDQWQKLSVEQIKSNLLEISPVEFEKVVERLMHYLGYPNVKVTKRTGDGGIDVLSTRVTDHGTERIAAQCKRHKNPIGVSIAREFQGAIQDDRSIVKGYLVTTSEFTMECTSYCVRHNIELIHGIKIAEYIKSFGIEINK